MNRETIIGDSSEAILNAIEAGLRGELTGPQVAELVFATLSACIDFGRLEIINERAS